jgi:hypothetical protein
MHGQSHKENNILSTVCSFSGSWQTANVPRTIAAASSWSAHLNLLANPLLLANSSLFAAVQVASCRCWT